MEDKEATKYLGEDYQLGYDIWNKKYRRNEESFDEWLDRVSNFNKNVRKLIVEKKFLFAGRTLANRGITNSGSFSNCYSSGYAPDSLEGILDLNKDIGLTYKQEGGQGISLSKIRPKGTKVRNSYQSDGIEPFMKIFDTTTSSVSQGGNRRGALMLSLNIEHKEAPMFISIKENTNVINNANLSLEISDRFMQFVYENIGTNEDAEYEHTEWFKDHTISVTYDIYAVKLFKHLCKSAWKSAEPGVLFTDMLRNYNMMQYVDGYDIITTNPCFHGSMKLLTAEGYKSFESLAVGGPNKTHKLINKDGETVDGKVWCSGEKEILQIEIWHHDSIFCTPNHRFLTAEDKEVEAKDLDGCELKSYDSNEVYIVKKVKKNINGPQVLKVYDFTLKDFTHWGVVEGVIAHNCGRMFASI